MGRPTRSPTLECGAPNEVEKKLKAHSELHDWFFYTVEFTKIERFQALRTCLTIVNFNCVTP